VEHLNSKVDIILYNNYPYRNEVVFFTSSVFTKYIQLS